MKSIRKILAFLFLLMAGLMIVGLSLPSEWAVERSVEIARAPDELFPLVADLRSWPDWMITFEHDPAMQAEFSHPSTGEGATFAWSGNTSVGEGRWEIGEVTEGQSVTLHLEMRDGGFTAQGGIEIIPRAGESRVTWRLGGALGKDPFARINRRLLENTVGGTLQANLDKLKRVAETAH